MIKNINMSFINIAEAGPMASAPPASSYLTGAVEFVVVFVGALAILGVLISGVMYMMSGGDSASTEAAKKALTTSVIGLVIALLSLIIVKTVIGLV